MAIKERLCGLSSNLQVIPIVGMGGIGKTTLANSVYDSQLIIERFDLRAWVVVSQDYDPHRFRKTLLDSMKLLEKQMSGNEMKDSEIELKVYQNLKGRRYLVVIDDVWGTHFWDDVKYIFPDDNNGSRIMLTTRQMNVAAYPCSAGPLHEMRFLDDSESWDLLKQKVFTNGYCPPYLEDVGKEISRRCAGLPLAVVLVAGTLSQVSKTRVSWEEIAKNVNPVVGQELEEILSLSYTCLPHHLRPCFLFIGDFLDVNIPTSRLIRLWVAEGFLYHQNGCSKSLEEEAEEYLEDLVKRNLVIVTSRKSDGKIKNCRLHDIVRELCIRKAHEEKFLHVMDGNERRISLSRSDSPNFHTILCFQIQNFPSWLASLLGSYKLLRVLDVFGVDMKVLPSEVFELYHLRYLALMGSLSIPSAVSNLVNLQTLIIHLSSGKLWGKYANVAIHSLPLEIRRMPQLRHLLLYAPYMLPHPLKGWNPPLENLQTLLLVTNLVWNEKILQMIPNVKRLGLTYTVNEKYYLHHLKDLHQLEKLEVICYLGFSLRVQNPSFPCTLKKLTLVGGGFPWENMAIVGSLPNLEVLKLLDNSCNGETWEAVDEDFPRLKFLLINDSNLQHWITQGKPFPTLKRLVLYSCRFLRKIPKGVGDNLTLELIEVDCCTRSLLESAKKIKEDQESFGNYDLQVRVGHEYQQTDKCNVEEEAGKRRRHLTLEDPQPLFHVEKLKDVRKMLNEAWSNEYASVSEFKHDLEEEDKEAALGQVKLLYGWVFWRENEVEQHPILTMLKSFASGHWIGNHYLMQFWGVVKVEGRNHHLSTLNYPFAVGLGLKKGNCWYRNRCRGLAYVVGDDDQEQQLIGGVGRAYRKKQPESTPDLRLYSTDEFTMRDEAALCGFRGYMALPLFHSHTNTSQCCGVLELLSEDMPLFHSELVTALQLAGLRSTHNPFASCSGETPFHTKQQQQLDREIRERLELVMATVPRLYSALVWVPCKQCCVNMVNTNLRCMEIHSLKVFRIGVDDDDGYYYDYDKVAWDFHEACKLHKLQIDVSSSFSANLCDVSMSISENPLAHYAQRARLSHSLAILLQSLNNSNHLYLIQFFLLQPNFREDDACSLLLRIMNMNLKTFKLVRDGSLVAEPQNPNAIACESIDSLQVIKSYKQEFSESNIINYLNTDDSCCLRPSSSARGWVFRSPLLVPIGIEEKKDNFMKNIVADLVKGLVGKYWILQFWAPKIVGGRCYLQALDQPYAVGCLTKGITSFRNKCMLHYYVVDDEAKEEELGPPRRVFRNGHPEISPDLYHYTAKEYPIRNYAMHCCNLTRGYFALPIFDDDDDDDKHNHKCVGVLEVLGFHYSHLNHIAGALKFHAESKTVLSSH